MDLKNYNLRWHTYSDHLRDMMRQMIESDEFTDVTLVTDDKKVFKAHRNVLSACSPVFKNILQMQNENNHSVIYLRGIEYSELEGIMQFIYLGEAKFCEERMNEFISVAKNLEIIQLSKNLELDDPQHDPPHYSDENEGAQDDDKYLNESTEPASESNVESYSISNEVEHKEVSSNLSKFECSNCDKVFSIERKMRRHFQYVHKGKNYACMQCEQQFTDPNGLRRHVRYKHEGVRYACSQCDYQATTTGNLKKHVQAIHEGVKFACNQCDYQVSQQQQLTAHIKKKHL